VLLDDLVVSIGGATGREVFNFEAGASVNQILAAVNLVSDATGVAAAQENGSLQLNSTAYGSDAFVDVDVLDEGSAGTFESGLSASRAEGADIQATVNGVNADGDGNVLRINTATLDLKLTVADGDETNFTFEITGGGALFQLGPDVVSNQQARLGIQSINAAKLGGPSGKLYELASGGGKSLLNDPNGAFRVVDEVIDKVTTLRGRLGAFQRTTLDTNIASLSDTLTNLTEAESAIRDADFAKESSALTRAQILVQSGTSVLAIANSNPQSVLSLLR
jgi:flagellin